MLASTMPPWKVEITERKCSEKLKADRMPTWKRELLKRLQTKAELTKHKIAEEAKRKEEQLVLDEHILKVSDNVFVRQELQRKMSAGQIAQLDPWKDDGFVLPNRHIINKDNIVIVEQEHVTRKYKEKKRFSNGEILDVELPAPGIVSKLKGKFASDSKANMSVGNVSISGMDTSAVQHRSKFKESSKTGQTNESATVMTSSVGGCIPDNDILVRKYSFEEKPSRPRIPSLEIVAPIGFSTRDSRHGSISEPNNRTKSPPLLKKYSDSLLTVATNPEDAVVDMASPDESGSQNDKGSLSLPSDQYTDEDKCLSKVDSSTTGDVVETQKGDEIDLEMETLVLNSVDVVNLVPARGDSNKDNLVAMEAVHHLETSTSVSLPAQSTLLASSNKENIPEIPDRLTAPGDNANKEAQLSKTADPLSSLSSSKIQNIQSLRQTDTPRIIDLGHTSMDPSLLKTKAAIAANEIMKESKTMMIIPKNKHNNMAVPAGTNSKMTAKNIRSPKDLFSIENNASEVSDQKLDVNSSTDLSMPNSTEDNDAKASISVLNESQQGSESLGSNSTLEKKCENRPTSVSTVPLPTSSIDGHITTAQFREEEKKSVVVTDSKDLISSEKGKPNEIKLPHPQTNYVPVSSFNKPTKNSTKFVANSTNRPVVTNRAASSNDAIKSLFGQKLGSSTASTSSSFGRKSFVIDPRKFKKSSAQPTAAASTKATAVTKTTSTLGNGNTIVITPKSQTGTGNTGMAKPEVTSGSKGKRKLTVDQITVIGGYVKLDHSNLSRPNKIRKGTHVKFNASHLESIYQYPSEASLMHEDINSQSNPADKKVTAQSGVIKENQVDKYSPKDLLAMRESLADEDDDDEDSVSASRT